ncbi:hypothetical protein, partial [Pantoea sp. 18069]|uniref:beta strand repeat-containing protein n=1 Tax=Pantoea sp. 18069 TaxID=2681415 RepID=UPI00190F52C9
MATAPRKDIPNPSAPNWGPRVTEELRVLMGRVGNGRALTATDLISAGIAKPGVGGGLVPGGPSSGGEADLTPPPMPTGVTVAAGLTTVLVEHDAPVYSQGHGHDRTVVYGVLQTGDTPPTFDQAVMLFQFQGNIGAYPAAIGTRYRLWLKWMSVDGVQSAAPAGGTNGLDVQTGKIGNNDLGPLIVEAQNLADGAISGSKLAADSIDATKFAQGIEPVTIVDGPELPAEKRTTNISWSGALYTWNGERYKAAALGDISFTQINGLIIADQIAEGILTTAKFAQGLEPVTIAPTLPSVKSTTNVVFNNELYTWDGTKYSKSVKTTDLAGTITAGQIAAGAIDVTKFASGLEPVEIVASLPGSKTTTNVVFGGELYTWSGTAYSKAVKAADITGQLIAAQIAVGAIDATKFASGVEPVNIVGTLPTVKSTSNVVFNNELYTWNGTAYSKTVKTNDLVGTISTSQIAAGAIDVTKFASGLEPVSVVASLPGTKTTTNVVFGNELYTWNGTAYSKAVKAVDITGQLLAAQIAAGAIDATKFASGIEPITVVTVLPTVKGTTNVVFNNELYTWNGTVYSKAVKTTDLTGTIGSAQIAPGAIDTSKLANGAVDAAKFASGIEPVAVVMVLPTVKSTANVVFGNELYTWNGTAYSKAVKAVDITGQLLAAQIAAGAIDATKFASGIEPVSVVGSLPGTKTTSNVVFNNELYTWNGTVYSKAVKAVDVTGQLTNAQIADIAAAKLAGQIVGTQISDLAISTPKLAAGAVVADKIAANAIVADKINANAVTTAKIATGAVTATEIAANAVTADKIIANAVTTAKIAAGAVTAAEIAAGAVTTAKLVVTDTNAVNIDPYFQDEAAWTIGSTSVTTVALAAGAVNSKAWTSTVVAVAVNPQRNKIDSSKSYLLEVWMRDASAAGNGAQFLQFHFYNAAGAIIAGTAGTGWPSINGNNHYFPGTNTQPAVTWTRYTLTMGPDGTAQIPAAAVEYTIGGWFNYNATVLTAQWFGAIRITEMARGELIVDGAITADKISANAITAGKIAAGSITATQLATNSVTADKIIANAVTTAKIATGAVTANEVAAKTITADKLVIGNSANLLADPTFDAGRGWAVGASFAYSTTTTGPDGSSAVKPVMLVTPQGPDVSSANADWGGFTLPAMTSVAAGSRFRYTMTARVVSGTAGSLRLRLLELAPGLANSWPILINLNGTSANGQWVTLTAERDLPADRTHMTVQLQANGAVGTVFEVAEVSMRQMATGELIVDGAITADKIAANSVTAAKIVAGTITATELATNSVTTIKIAANAVTATEIAANAITVDKIIANAVTTAKIA